MNLMKFKGADDAVKLTIRLSAGYCIILTIAFASSIIFLINKIEKAYGGCAPVWHGHTVPAGFAARSKNQIL